MSKSKLQKLTVISSYFAPAWAYGGPPKVLYILSKQLIKLGIQIDVITTDSLGEERSNKLFEEMDGIRVHRFRNLSNYLAYGEKLFYVPHILKDIKGILEGTNVVLFSDLRSVFNGQIYNYIKQLNIPYGIFSFGQIPYSGTVKFLLKKVFDMIWVKDFVRSSTYQFAQTKHEKVMYETFFGIPESKVKLLPLPIELKLSKPDMNDLDQFRYKYHLKKENKIILYIGRINFLKGIDILIEALKELLKEDKNLILLIVGRDDGYLKTLINIISSSLKKQIIFTGPIYGSNLVPAFYVSSCFSITPRYHEETSTAALEALSYGLPVVVTKEAEIPFLSNYRAGFLVENYPQNISRAIKKIIYSTDKEKKQMSIEARKCIQDHFQAEKVAKQLMEILSVN